LATPISIKLRCASWAQLASIYKRDLSRSAIFLRSATPPPLGTPVRIDLTLPSDSMVVLSGVIARHVRDDELDPQIAGRGAGVDVRLNALPQSAMWLIETALASSAAQKEQKARPPTQPAAPAPQEAGTDEGNEVAAAETELLVALTSELGAMKNMNPFQVLGIKYEATDAEIRAAFGDQTKRYHPDRFARYQSPELRALAAEIFILVRDAYRKLGDQAGRAQVLAQLGRRDFAMADSMLDAGKYDEALAFFKVLARKVPHDRQAKAGIELAEGLRALSARDRFGAAQRFEAVLELDPANERAARELAEMRRVATNERKGMLSRLLGKKE